MRIYNKIMGQSLDRRSIIDHGTNLRAQRSKSLTLYRDGKKVQRFVGAGALERAFAAL